MVLRAVPKALCFKNYWSKYWYWLLHVIVTLHLVLAIVSFCIVNNPEGGGTAAVFSRIVWTIHK